ncbi:MAG TPA: hypothetical protein VHT25_11680 [Solirubrobacteraceae bacterium]|jgi:hypothetical protein|nr:hypothetical protein [Solirubrobacteraceae bacterium]
MRIALSQSRATGLALICALVALASLTATAGADTGTKIIERCTHGQSISGFSQKDYRRALAELPTEVEEYSDCANLIRRAQLLAAGGGSGSNGSGAPPTATPLSSVEKAKLGRVPKTGAGAQKIGTQTVRPGVVHANISSAFSSLPDSLLAVLAFMLACAVALGGRSAGKVVRARRAG